MPELLTLHNIAYRAKKGAPRQVIPANSRFNTEDYPGISQSEWDAMLNGEPPIVRRPDDPNYVTPQQQRATANAPVPEGRSPRTDMNDAKTVGGITVPTNATEEADEEDEEDEEEQPAAKNRRGRRAKPVVEDEDDI